MAFYYRGLLYWRDGQPDNARACFRSAQFIDADAEILAHPAAFEHVEADVMVCEFKHPEIDRTELLSGTVYFRNNLRSHRVVDAWIEECARAGVPPVLNMVGLVLAAGSVLRFGTPDQKERFARLRESVRLMRELWGGGRADFDGEYYHLRGASIYDVPEGGVPVYIAAGGPAVAKYAGRAGDGFICTSGKGEELYTEMSGTSMATPHVVGVVSLMFSVNPLLTPAQVPSADKDIGLLLRQAMDSTAKLTAFVVFILVGARVFSLSFYGVDGHKWVEELLTGLPGGQIGFLIVVNLIVFFLAFFLDFFELAFIVIPLLGPVAEKLGIDLIWFGVLLAVNMQTSFMHPPFGFALFYLRSVAPERDYVDKVTGLTMAPVTTAQIYWGAIPFVVIQCIMVALVILFRVARGMTKELQ